MCPITHTVTSNDPGYKTHGPVSFTVSVLDDDLADVFLWTISPDEYETSTVDYNESYNVKFLPFYNEENSTVAYAVRLETEPTADVTVQPKVTLLNTTNLLEPPTLFATPESLTFTPSNWNTRQRISLRSVGDNVDHDMERFQIEHTITTTDSVFQARADLKAIVAVCDVSDDDTVGSVLEENVGVTLRAGNSKEIKIVRLASMPTDDVTILVDITSTGHVGDVTATPSEIFVQQHDWNNVNRTITLSIVASAPKKGDPKIQVRATSSDAKYNTMSHVNIIATVTTAEDKPEVSILKGPAKHSPEKADWHFTVSSNDTQVD